MIIDIMLADNRHRLIIDYFRYTIVTQVAPITVPQVVPLIIFTNSYRQCEANLTSL